jgi:deferrochelatase/peroxidase EfeB
VIDLAAAKIQRIVVTGNKCDHARYLLLRIAPAPADERSAPGEPDRVARQARRWLGAMADELRLAAPRDADDPDRDATQCSVGLGLSYRALERLALPREILSVFEDRAPGFAEGAYFRAARRLADTGASDSEHWEPAFAPDAHVLVTLHGANPDTIASRMARLQRLDGADALTGWDTRFDGAHLGQDPTDRRVHFGLKDGITKVLLEGVYPGAPRHDVHKNGEVLLGHDNDAGFDPWVLADRPDRVADFFRNGSFGIFRKVAQDVPAFKTFVETAAGRLGVSPEYLVAKMVGRWDDGQVVDAASPSTPPPPLPAGAPIDDFTFANDPKGFGCPFGSHIRRMNPRSDTIVPKRLRPLVRRGIPYGPSFERGPAEADRGLFGLFFCASIEDQFEHLIAEWGDKKPMGVDNRGDAKDPLAGNHGPQHTVFDIPRPDGESLKVTGLQPFCTTRGTVYTFFPSRDALLAIAGVAGTARRG